MGGEEERREKLPAEQAISHRQPPTPPRMGPRCIQEVDASPSRRLQFVGGSSAEGEELIGGNSEEATKFISPELYMEEMRRLLEDEFPMPQAEDVSNLFLSLCEHQHVQMSKLKQESLAVKSNIENALSSLEASFLHLEASESALQQSEVVIEALREHFERIGRKGC